METSGGANPTSVDSSLQTERFQEEQISIPEGCKREKRQEKEGKNQSRLDFEIVCMEYLVEADGKRGGEGYRKNG